MSHISPKPSTPGTPLPKRTLGEIATNYPKLSRVFKLFDFDLCYHGDLNLHKACKINGIELEDVLAAFERERVSVQPPLKIHATLPLSELTAYIVEQHHGFLRNEIPHIYTMAKRVAQVHCADTPSLVEVYLIFAEMGEELIQHMQKEEHILFPLIAGLEMNETDPDILNGPVGCLMEEHEGTNVALARLRELTRSYQPPAEGCTTYRVLFARLSYFEADIRQHIHLENDILFPRALEWAS